MSKTGGRGEREHADARDGTDVAAGSSRAAQQHLESTTELTDVETAGSQTEVGIQSYENSMDGHDDATPTGTPSSGHLSPQTRSGPGISNRDVARQGIEENQSITAPATNAPLPQDSTQIDYNTEWLDLSRAVIEAKRTKDLARALESGKLKNVKTLYLHNNAADLGVRAALNAMQQGYLSKLKKLILWNTSSYDQITPAEEGTETIANAIGNNKMPKLQTLDLTSSLQKLIPPRPLSEVKGDLMKGYLGMGRIKRFKHIFCSCSCLTSDNCSTLECLNCHMWTVDVYSGNDGLKKIVEQLGGEYRPPLKVLNLRNNYIGDVGVKFLASNLMAGNLPELEEVDLQNNPVGLEGARAIVSAYVDNPLLTANVLLDWPDPILKERASAFREKNIRLEHRLADLDGIKMVHGKISRSYNWRPDFTLVKPSRTEHYWLRLLCQHPDHQDNSSHDNGKQTSTQAKQTQIMGIEIRKKSIFRRPQKVLATEYSNAQVSNTEKSRELTDVETHRASPDYVQNQKNPSNTRSDSVLSSNVPLPIISLSPKSDAATAAENLHPIPEESLTNVSLKSETRMYITVGSSLFLSGNAKSGNPNQVPEEQNMWNICKSVSSIRACTLPTKDKEKKERVVKAVIMELLIVADRKPQYFQEVFGLTRVLLQDGDGLHYPSYVCDYCNSKSSTPTVTVVEPRYLQPSLYRSGNLKISLPES